MSDKIPEMETVGTEPLPVQDEPINVKSIPVPSFGQKAVGYSFNPGGSNEVSKFKELMAIAIDQMNELRSTTTSLEVKRLCSITITELQGAQMWGVKAITWKD